jgi:formate hydrogenlyase subunit 4
MDVGSSFEGMGASREAAFGALGEPALFLGLAIVCIPAGGPSFEAAWGALPWATWGAAHPAMIAAAAGIFLYLLAENARIPVDDPSTHLELTMIHEVMVLDHGGVDLAFILYGAALKLWLLGSILMGIAAPIRSGSLWVDSAAAVATMMSLAVATGAIESSMARLRLVRVPQLLVGAGVLSVLALVLVLR